MLENIKIFASDTNWQHVFVDLGAILVDSPNAADVVFDDIKIKAPISIDGLKSAIFSAMENQDIISKVFGRNVVLSKLQHKIIVMLYKNPNLTMSDMKEKLGFMPDVATHAVENAIYQIRKTYGHSLIQNVNGKYKIGCL